MTNGCPASRVRSSLAVTNLYCGAALALLPLLGQAQSVDVYVAYAENERPSIFFPNPWLGSPHTTFLGYPGIAWDTGAILIVNTGASDILLGQGAKVDGFKDPTKSFQLWDQLIPTQGLTIHPGKQVILAQTGAQDASGNYSPSACIPGVTVGATCYSNFDSSDTPVASALNTSTPVIHLTLNGVQKTYTDTGQILNTGGFDFGNTLVRNESLQWRLVGTTGPLFPGGSGVRPAAVATWHNDNARTGAYGSETTLRPVGTQQSQSNKPIPNNVNDISFGKLFSYHVDGQVYAQPLFVPDVDVPGRGRHNVVIVATENNSVYAFDAETNSGNGGLLWGATSLGTPVPESDIGCGNIIPSYGVTSTPVVDTTAGKLYVVSANKELNHGGTYSYEIRLHVLDLKTGQDISPSNGVGPMLRKGVAISGSVTGTGDTPNGSPPGTVVFDPTEQLQRPALLLYKGTVYIAFGSHCDAPKYHGWLFGYNAADISQQTAVFNTTPNATSVQSQVGCPGWNGWDPAGGAIWMGGAGPAADANGIYVTTANGHFDANLAGGADYADTILRLVLSGATRALTVADYFTPYDQRNPLECQDADLGAGGLALLPNSSPPLLVQVSKPGTLYFVNRSNMGKFNAGCNPGVPACDHIQQEITQAVKRDSDRSPAYFDNTIYMQGGADDPNDPGGDTLKAFKLGTTGNFSLAAESTSPYMAAGGTPSISYDSTSTNPPETATVWSIEVSNSGGSSVLHAYRADTLQELYHSDSSGIRDRVGETPGFPVPTVAAGKVFVGTSDSLVVYGGGFFTSWTGTISLGGFAKQLTVGRNPSGLLEAFYVGTDNGIYENFQVSPDNSWGGEKRVFTYLYSIGFPALAKQITFGQGSDGALEPSNDAFFIDPNNAIYFAQILPSNNWWVQPLGGYAKQIAAGQNEDGRLELFYLGTDSAIYHNWPLPGGGWSGQQTLGGFGQQIVVGKNEDGRLEVFYVGTNNAIYHNWQIVPNGGWAGESALGGSALQIAVGENQDGRLEVFYVGTDNVIYHNWQVVPNGGWAGETPLGGSAKQIAVTQNQDGRLEVFYIGLDDAIYHNYQTIPNGGWDCEHALSAGGSRPYSAKQIAVALNKDGRIWVLYIGLDDAIYQIFQTAPNNRWSH